jgi:hypothetical protein
MQQSDLHQQMIDSGEMAVLQLFFPNLNRFNLLCMVFKNCVLGMIYRIFNNIFNSA